MKITVKIVVSLFIIIIILSGVAASSGCLGDKLERLVRDLHSEDPFVRQKAAKALGETKDPRAVEPLIAALEDEVFFVQSVAMDALVEIGTAVVEPLIAAVLRKDGDTRHYAARTLGNIGAPAVKRLITAIRDEQWLVRLEVAEGLAESWKPHAKETSRTLLEQLAAPFARVCAGEGVEELPVYGDGSAPHPLIILDSSGNIHEWTHEVPAEWIPASLHDTELVACVERTGWVVIEVRRYEEVGTGIVYTGSRSQYQVEIRLLEARTGKVVASTTLYGSPPRVFPEEVSVMFKEQLHFKGSTVSFEEVQDWLNLYVTKG